jgi:hypothetical protein
MTVDHFQTPKIPAESLVDGALQFPQVLVTILPRMNHIDMMNPTVGSGTNRHLTLRANEPAEGFRFNAAMGAFGIGFH